MKQEEKDLLLQDLSARLPYGVKVKTNNINVLKLGTHTRVGEYITDVIEPCKPYLFPMSSMTKEQRIEYNYLHSIIFSCFEDGLCEALAKLQDWLNKNHFDYRGLIPMGLALNATGLNIY